MDVYRAITTMRSIRQFTQENVRDETITKILEAGRWAGSAKNTQPCQFIVVKNHEMLNRLAACGKYASHLREAAFSIVVVTEPVALAAEFDSARAIQNMMLAAWDEGVGSCIATLQPDEDEAKRALAVPDDLKIQQAISFGYPSSGTPTIEGKPLKDVLAQTGRKPLANIVHYEKWKQKSAH